MLTISVKNFGPIAEGSVDLKPLTIFVGPSNTGKSYMATAVYAVIKAFEGIPVNTYGFYNRRLGKSAWFQPQQTRELRFDRDNAASALDSLRQWAKSIDMEALADRDLLISEMPQEAQDLANNSAKDTVSDYLQSLGAELDSNLGSVEELLRKHPGSERIFVDLVRSDPLLELAISLDPESGSTTLIGSTVSTSEARIEGSDPIFLHYLNLLKQEQTTKRLGQLGDYRNLVAAVMEAGTVEFFSNIPTVAHYFPAARSGLMEGYKPISSNVLRRSSRTTNLPRTASFRGTTANFLGDLLLLDWGRSYRESAELKGVVGFIENNVLGGNIDLDNSSDLPYPEIIYETTSGNFPLTRSSSMVSELAPLVLFLKYLVRHGDLLIIEEPESHLHPAAQRQLARGIVRLVNSGVKVLITTHSETFITQINHLLRISYASKRWLRKHNFELEDCISHDHVGAYQFAWDEEQGGSVVKRLVVHKDIGIDEAEFIGVIDSLYEESLLVQRIRVKE